MMPTKNQMESDSPFPVPSAIKSVPSKFYVAVLPVPSGAQMCGSPPGSVIALPENNLQNHEDNGDYGCPEDWLLEKRRCAVVRDDRRAIDEAVEFALRTRPGHQADDHRHAHADQPAPQRAEHVFRHGLRVGRKRDP